MRRINFDNLRKCEALYNFQENTFDFANSLLYGEDREYIPMPIKARDLRSPRHNPHLQIDRLSYFNLKSYVAGVRVGYSEPLPNSNEKILELAAENIILKYRDADKVCENSQANEFGVAVGMCFRAWVYIADNIEEFTKLWQVLLKEFEGEMKIFADCLIIENKEVLLRKLHLLIDSFKGKRIAHVLMVLIDKKMIDFRFRNKIFELMRIEFSFNTSDESINKYLKYDFSKKDEKEYTLVENALKY